jgi:MFS family permease
LRPYPFYLGVALSLAGFFGSWLLVRDTRHHVAKEAAASNVAELKNILKMSDYFCKKSMLFWGMLLQGLALVALALAATFFHYVALSVVLGWGTAMVYPTFLATIAENTHPHDRAKSLGVFRLWRDSGYVAGALLTGIIADALGFDASIITIGLLTLGSALIIARRMRCRTDAVKLGEWLIKNLQITKAGIHATDLS